MPYLKGATLSLFSTLKYCQRFFVKRSAVIDLQNSSDKLIKEGTIVHQARTT